MSELGELLRSARERRNLSLSDAAAATRIRQRYLEALEENDYGSLPAGAYATGFLRNYAQFLGLDPDEVLQTYHALQPPGPIGVHAATGIVTERLKRRSRRRFSLLFVALAVVLLGAYAVREYNNDARAGNSPLPVSTSGLTQGHGPSRVTIAATSGLTKPNVRLTIHVLRPVWARITVDGSPLYFGPLQAGDVRTWRGQGRVTIVTRRGDAIAVQVNGRWRGRLSNLAQWSQGTATSVGWSVRH